MHSASDHRRKIKTQVTILIIQIQSINVRINSILRVQITNIVKKEKDLKFSNSTKNFQRTRFLLPSRERLLANFSCDRNRLDHGKETRRGRLSRDTQNRAAVGRKSGP